MSFINPEAIGFRDSANMSAWGRVRVANSFNHFDNLNVYGLNARDWASLNVGGATGVHLPNEAAVELRTNNTTLGTGAFRASRVSWQISMGRGFTMWAAGTYGPAINGVRRRAGYFDTGDGVFLEQTITDLRFVLRTSVSGAPSDAIFAAQADWNIDRLDGTGPSGLTLDITLRQLFFFDIQWLGTGRIRCGFYIDGEYRICHEFISGNTAFGTFWKTPNLPLRAELENIATADSTATFKLNGSAIQIEGGDDAFRRGYLNSCSNGTTLVNVTTRRPIISVRAMTTYVGQPNRGWLLPQQFSFRTSGNDLYWEVIVNGTLTGPAFAPVGGDSLAEFDVTATAIAGGVKILEGYSIAGTGSTSDERVSQIFERFPAGVETLNNTATQFSIVGTSLAATSTNGAAILWREIY